jgi:hypothetical protein
MTALVVGIKYQDDEYYKNEFYAKVGGIPKQELNVLEAEFLKLLDFQLHVPTELYLNYRDKLSKYGDF